MKTIKIHLCGSLAKSYTILKKNNVKGQTIYKYKGYGILNTKIKVRAFKYIYIHFQNFKATENGEGKWGIFQ